jgi:hypothetical protein
MEEIEKNSEDLDKEGQENINRLREEYVISDEEINKALEEQGIWDVINYLEDRLGELEELMDEGPLTPELENEYYEKSREINELLDMIDDGDD